MIVNEEKSGILKGQISDAFNALKHNGMPRLSIKRIKEIAAKAWAGIHPNSD